MAKARIPALAVLVIRESRRFVGRHGGLPADTWLMVPVVTEAKVVRAIQALLIAFIVAVVALVALLFLRAIVAGGSTGDAGDGECFRSSPSTMTCIMP